MAFLPCLIKKILFFLLFVWSLDSMGQNHASRYWGILDDFSFSDTTSISQLRKQFGKQPAFVSRLLDWHEGGLNFPATESDQIKASGSIPFISIDLAISLSDILKGKYNTVLEQFGAKIHSYNSPVFIRWAREPIMLAERYASNQWVGGYDILNETKPFAQNRVPGIYLIRVGDEQTIRTQPLLIKNM